MRASICYQPLPTVANQHQRRMVFGLGCQVRRALSTRSAKNRQFQQVILNRCFAGVSEP